MRPQEVPLGWRLGPVLLIVGGIAAAVVIAFSIGAISLPGAGDAGAHTPASEPAAATAPAAADAQWASTACTSVLEWKNEIARDESSLNLSFGPLARIRDALAATTRLRHQLLHLGVPPGAQTAISSLVRDLETGKLPVAQVVEDVRHLLSANLGVSLVEARACRQLIGIPI